MLQICSVLPCVSPIPSVFQYCSKNTYVFVTWGWDQESKIWKIISPVSWLSMKEKKKPLKEKSPIGDWDQKRVFLACVCFLLKNIQNTFSSNQVQQMEYLLFFYFTCWRIIFLCNFFLFLFFQDRQSHDYNSPSQCLLFISTLYSCRKDWSLDIYSVFSGDRQWTERTKSGFLVMFLKKKKKRQCFLRLCFLSKGNGIFMSIIFISVLTIAYIYILLLKIFFTRFYWAGILILLLERQGRMNSSPQPVLSDQNL